MRRLLLTTGALRFFDSFTLIYPLYTVMFAERGLSPSQIGFVLAAWSGVALVAEVPCGVLADRMSRPVLMSVSQLVRCVGLGMWLAFPGFWGFLIGLMLWGLKSATLSGAFEAVIYDELKRLGREGEYARVFGRTQAARFSGLLAASLGAAVMAHLGYEVLIWGSLASGVAASAAALTVPHAPPVTSTSRRGYFAHLVHGARQAARLPGVPPLLLFIAGSQAIASAAADYWQIFAKLVGLPKSGIGLFMAAMAVTGAISAALAHRMHALPARGFALILALAGTCVVAAAASFQPWSIALLIAYVGLYWLVDTNADARFQHALEPETRATVASVKGFAMQSGTLTLMLSFGLIAEAASYRTAFLCTGAAALLLGAGYAIGRPRTVG